MQLQANINQILRPDRGANQGGHVPALLAMLACLNFAAGGAANAASTPKTIRSVVETCIQNATPFSDLLSQDAKTWSDLRRQLPLVAVESDDAATFSDRIPTWTNAEFVTRMITSPGRHESLDTEELVRNETLRAKRRTQINERVRSEARSAPSSFSLSPTITDDDGRQRSFWWVGEAQQIGLTQQASLVSSTTVPTCVLYNVPDDLVRDLAENLRGEINETGKSVLFEYTSTLIPLGPDATKAVVDQHKEAGHPAPTKQEITKLVATATVRVLMARQHQTLGSGEGASPWQIFVHAQDNSEALK